MGQVTYVGISEMSISNDPADRLVAANLGSCLGVAIFDPVERIGGVIHCLLPASNSDPGKAGQNPYMYVDTGVPQMIAELCKHGGVKKRFLIAAAGCGQMNDRNGVFEIGKKNFVMLRKVLWSQNLLLKAEDTGGVASRTLSLDIGTGEAWLRMQGETKRMY